VDELVARLSVYDDGGVRLQRWNAPASLEMRSQPAGAQAALEHDGERLELGVTPVARRTVPRGSAVLVLQLAGRAQARLPVLLARGEELSLEVALPRESAIPAGFVYVPAGRFLFGMTGDEASRRAFFETIPMHEVRTGPYLIGRNEVTYAEWIEFLDSLPPALQARHTPNAPAKVGISGALTPMTPRRTWPGCARAARSRARGCAATTNGSAPPEEPTIGRIRTGGSCALPMPTSTSPTARRRWAPTRWARIPHPPARSASST
jgi:formylglycine-generating enzyme required for sulfatase activity